MANLFSNKEPNAVAVTQLLLKALNVKVSKSTIENTLEDHPDYPSLLAISDSLTEWNIESQSYQFKMEDYNSDELLFPFIAHIKGDNLILIHEFKDAEYIYSDETHSQAVINETEFLTKWTGAALYATTKTISGEKTYRLNNIKDQFNVAKSPLLIVLILSSIFLGINYNAINIGYIILLALKLIGVGVSVLLLMHSINANNPLVQNLCSLGKKNNCNAILKSDAAKVTNWLSWSEVGLFYFAGSLLSLLFIPSSLLILALLNVLALPYTIYSITYQYKHKNWCILCCTVQALLVLECLTALSFGTLSFSLWSLSFSLWSLSFSLSSFYLLPLFLFPILAWAFLKPFLLKAQQVKPLKKQLKKFKYNSDLFKQVLQSQPKYAVGDELMPITLGNPNAETIITMVSNPFCDPCAKAHQTIDEWLSDRDDIQLKIIFTTTDHDDDEKTKVARHISALSLLNDANLIENALNDWYKQSSKKYDSWALKYPVTDNAETLANGEDWDTVNKKQREWCDMAEITRTPTILIDGYKLPELYRLEDIKYLIT